MKTCVFFLKLDTYWSVFDELLEIIEKIEFFLTFTACVIVKAVNFRMEIDFSHILNTTN